MRYYRPLQRLRPWRGMASVAASRREPLNDGITRHRNIQFNHVDREQMVRQRELWMVETLGIAPERAERYAGSGRIPPIWAENLPHWRGWLQQKLGLTTEQSMEILRKDPALLGGKLELADQVLEWATRSSDGPGWDMSQVRVVIYKYPCMFNKSPQKLQDTLEWLRDVYYDPPAGLAYAGQIPLIHQASLHGRIRPRYDLARQLGRHPGAVSITHIWQSSDAAFAERLGISVEECRRFEAEGSDYLTARRAKEQQRRIDWLQNVLGVDRAKAEGIVGYYTPGWEKNYTGWGQFLQDTGGLTDSEAREFLSRKYVLLSTNVSVAKKAVEWLAEHGPGQQYDGPRGWSHEEIIGCLRRAPMIFGKNTENLEATMNFYLSDEFTNGDPALKQKSCDTIRSNPSVLNCGLNSRIRPRHRLATSKGKRISMTYLFSLTDAKFCEKIGCTKEELAKFKEDCTVLFATEN